MSDKAIYLTNINNTITSYSNHSIVIKGFSLLVVICLFFISAVYRESNAYPVISITFSVIILSLWNLDTHLYRKKVMYSRLYAAVHHKEINSFSMDVSKYSKDVPYMHIMWKTHISTVYIAIMISAATLSLIKQ